MEIRYAERLEGSQAVYYVARAWCQLLKDRVWDRDNVLVDPDLSVLYAVENRKIIGCLTWHPEEDGESWTIAIGYVSLDHRRLGVYTALHNELVKRAKAGGIKRIISICKPDNEVIQKAKRKDGYKLHSLEYHLKVQ